MPVGPPCSARSPGYSHVPAPPEHAAATESGRLNEGNYFSREEPSLGEVDDDDAPEAQPAQPSSAARRWTSVPVEEKLHLQMHCQQKGYCYLFHLNEEDELSIVFPNKKDTENLVPEANHNLYVPGRFADGPKAQYLRFTGSHLQRETFYLLTISKRLEDFETVGALPMDLKKLKPRQAQAVLATLRRAAGGAATRGATFRDLDADLFAELDDDEDGSFSMALSTMTLISVGSAPE